MNTARHAERPLMLIILYLRTSQIKGNEIFLTHYNVTNNHVSNNTNHTASLSGT